MELDILLAGLTAFIVYQIIPVTHRVTEFQRCPGPNALNPCLCSFHGRRTMIRSWRWTVSWET